MANIILNGMTVVTQTGNDEPLIGGNVLMHSNAINTALSGATFPAGHVIQTRSITLLSNGTQVDVSYSTSGALNGTLDSNGIYRLKNDVGEYLTISNFSAKQGNLLIGTISYGGPNAPGPSLCWCSMGVQWGSENRRTFKKMGYDGGGAYHLAESSVITYTCLEDLTNVNVHAILRMEETGKTMEFATHRDTTANATNYGQLGGSFSDTAFYFIVQEIQQ